MNLHALETSFSLVAPRCDAIVPKLRDLGAHHVAYGAVPEHYRSAKRAELEAAA